MTSRKTSHLLCQSLSILPDLSFPYWSLINWLDCSCQESWCHSHWLVVLYFPKFFNIWLLGSLWIYPVHVFVFRSVFLVSLLFCRMCSLHFVNLQGYQINCIHLTIWGSLIRYSVKIQRNFCKNHWPGRINW